jgi:5'-nucleotidase
MKILVTNDDGVASPGLWALAKELTAVGEVLVVAPNRDMSGMAAAMMLRRPVRARRIRPPRGSGKVQAYAVNGPPAACTLLAVRGAIGGGGIDLVVSGINSGPNLGRDALLSGTVGAALMASLEGIPAIAVSTVGGERMHWQTAALIAGRLAGRMKDLPAGENLLLNLNVPNVAAEELAGARITHLSRDCCLPRLAVVADEARTNTFTLTTVRQVPRAEDEGSDEWAVASGYVSITPLLPDISFEVADDRLKAWVGALLPRVEQSPVAAGV